MATVPKIPRFEAFPFVQNGKGSGDGDDRDDRRERKRKIPNDAQETTPLLCEQLADLHLAPLKWRDLSPSQQKVLTTLLPGGNVLYNGPKFCGRSKAAAVAVLQTKGKTIHIVSNQEELLREKAKYDNLQSPITCVETSQNFEYELSQLQKSGSASVLIITYGSLMRRLDRPGCQALLTKLVNELVVTLFILDNSHDIDDSSNDLRYVNQAVLSRLPRNCQYLFLATAAQDGAVDYIARRVNPLHVVTEDFQNYDVTTLTWHLERGYDKYDAAAEYAQEHFSLENRGLMIMSSEGFVTRTSQALTGRGVKHYIYKPDGLSGEKRRAQLRLFRSQGYLVMITCTPNPSTLDLTGANVWTTMHLTPPRSEHCLARELVVDSTRGARCTNIIFVNGEDIDFQKTQIIKRPHVGSIHTNKMADFERFAPALSTSDRCTKDFTTPRNCGGSSVVLCKDRAASALCNNCLRNYRVPFRVSRFFRTVTTNPDRLLPNVDTRATCGDYQITERGRMDRRTTSQFRPSLEYGADENQPANEQLQDAEEQPFPVD